MIILASNSPRRRQILRLHGIRFRTFRPDYHEKNNSGNSPARLVRMHAVGKAMSVAQRISKGEVLSADSIVYCAGRIVGKPRNMAEASRFLKLLQGRWQTVYTGVAIFWVRGGRIRKKMIFVEKTNIYLEKMNAKQIKAYFRKVNPLDKAGGYALQAGRFSGTKRIRGSYFNAVGLPIERILSIMRP